MLSLLLYRIGIQFYYWGIRLLSLWNFKAKLWLQGRRKFPVANFTNEQVVWVHCASLGEFEQGRPLIEAIKLNYPGCKVAVSFFSSSGYGIAKNSKVLDYAFYLPEDSPRNAKKIIATLQPALVLWIKYEYWFYYLREIKVSNIPALLISGVYRNNMPFFKWYGGLWRKMLEAFRHFFVQDQQSKTILEKIIPAAQITNSGDTRFDRVISIAAKFTDVPGISKFCGASQVIVAGSTWEDDEAEWVHYVRTHPEVKFIIAPHEIDKENLGFIKKQFPASVFYSEWIEAGKEITSQSEHSTFNSQHSTLNTQPPRFNLQPPNCLIIDNIGMLSRLYRYATVCYVGGGFRSKGLHNILEAAVYGKPVIFGPEYHKNAEAAEMIGHGGAISIGSAVALENVLSRLLNDKDELKRSGEAAKAFIYSRAGATENIMAYIKKNAFLRADQTALHTDQNPSSRS